MSKKLCMLLRLSCKISILKCRGSTVLFRDMIGPYCTCDSNACKRRNIKCTTGKSVVLKMRYSWKYETITMRNQPRIKSLQLLKCLVRAQETKSADFLWQNLKYVSFCDSWTEHVCDTRHTPYGSWHSWQNCKKDQLCGPVTCFLIYTNEESWLFPSGRAGGPGLTPVLMVNRVWHRAGRL